MKKNSLDIYWENKLDFKYEEEILRYKMLCNDKISKKLVKKYNINPKYNTFSDWEKYIKEKILRISNEELKEYQKYINLKRINEDSISGTLNNFLIPFLIAVVGQLVVEGIKSYLQIENDNIIADIIYWLVTYFMFAYFVYFMTRNIIKEDREQKRDQLFYAGGELLRGNIFFRHIATEVVIKPG